MEIAKPIQVKVVGVICRLTRSGTSGSVTW
jgi:hypothetical protein